MIRRFVAVVIGCILLCGIALQWMVRHSKQSRRQELSLKAVVPETLHGWVVYNESLGQTEAINNHALHELQLDDYVYRSFSSSTVTFSIYAAHWLPGRVTWQDVATHTPDTCWTANGWMCIDRMSKYSFGWGDLEFTEGKWRKFVPSNGRSMEVLFWHVAGNRIVAYDAELRLSGLRESVRQLFSPKTDQYFIRVSSTTAIAELKKDPGFRRAFSGFGELLQRQNFQ